MVRARRSRLLPGSGGRCVVLGLLVLVMSVGLSACGAGSDRAEDGSAGEAAPVADSAATPASQTLLALDGEGLRLVDATTGSTRPVAFGSDEVTVREVLEATLGAPPVERGDAVDCALEYVRWESGLTTWFADGNFVGWAVRDEGRTLTTMAGIGLGSSRAELEGAYAAEIAPSSLGLEFHAGGLAGLLEGDEEHSQITHLWAGNSCIAR